MNRPPLLFVLLAHTMTRGGVVAEGWSAHRGVVALLVAAVACFISRPKRAGGRSGRTFGSEDRSLVTHHTSILILREEVDGSGLVAAGEA